MRKVCFKLSFKCRSIFLFQTKHSLRQLGVLFFLDKKQNQKNQDWLMQPCNAAPTAHVPSQGYASFYICLIPIFLILKGDKLKST